MTVLKRQMGPIAKERNKNQRHQRGIERTAHRKSEKHERDRGQHELDLANDLHGAEEGGHCVQEQRIRSGACRMESQIAVAIARMICCAVPQQE